MKKKINILYITDTYVGGKAGSERHLYQLVSNLHSSEFNIHIIQLTSKTGIPYLYGNLDDKKNIFVERIPVYRIYSPRGMSAIWRIATFVRQNNIDIVQSLHEKADIINALIPKRNGFPIKVSSRRDMGFKKGKKLRLLFRRLNSRFDRIIAPSSAILEKLCVDENVKTEQTVEIGNGVDLRRFICVTQESKIEAKRLLEIPDEAFCIGCIANLKEVKGHRYLIEAFSKLSQEQRAVYLVLVGEGELRSILESQSQTTPYPDRIMFLGHRDDVSVLLHAFDILVSSSLSEGLSNALIEGAATGIPIVATKVGGNPDIVNDGINGYLVEPEDSVQLKTAIRKLLVNSEKRLMMGISAREMIESRYSLQTINKRYLKFYEELMQ